MRCATGEPCPRARRRLPRPAGWSSPTASAISPAPDPPRRGRANALTPAVPYAALHPPLSEICPPCPTPRISTKTESHLRFVGQAAGICLDGSRAFDPKAVAVLLEAFNDVVAEVDLRTHADKERAAKIIIRLALGQKDLDMAKLRDSAIIA